MLSRNAGARLPGQRAKSWQSVTLPAVVLAVFWSAASCSGGAGPTGTQEPPGSTLFTEISCPGISYAATRGVPLDEIAVGVLPSALSSPAAVSVSSGDLEQAGAAYLLTEDSDGGAGVRLLVPLHPETPLAGGPVELRIFDGTRACPPVHFTIDPLPPAPGEFSNVVDLVQEVLTRQAALFESTPDELVSTPIDELPAALLPLALAQTVLDDPANPESLTAIADGALGAESVAWLDRLIARTGLQPALEALLSSPPPGPTAAPARVAAIRCVPEAVNGADASVLNMCMEAAAAAHAAANGGSKEVADDIQAAFKNLTKAFGASASAGFAPSAPAGAASGAVETGFGALFWVIYNQRERTAALFPSRFTSFVAELDQDRFLEDEHNQGDEGVGSVSEGTVYATSLGWNLQREIEGAAEQATSVSKTSGLFDFSTNTPADKMAEQLASKVDERSGDTDIDELDLPPELFGPVDVAHTDWMQVRLAAGNAVEVVDNTLTFQTREEGTATLSVRTHDGKFGDQQIFTTADVTVLPITIIITPMETTVPAADPNVVEFVTLEIEVQDAQHPDAIEIDLSVHPQQGIAELRRTEGGSIHWIDYEAPVHPDYDEVDLIDIYYTGRTGARKHDLRRRGEIATIRFGDVEISPRTACVDLDTEFTFQVEVEGPADKTVRWTAVGGTIDEDTGVFRAPTTVPTGATATITATSVADPNLTDEVTIQIGCTCTSTLTVAGRTVTSEAGSKVFFTDWGGPDEPYGNNYEFFSIVFQPGDGSQTATFPLDDAPGTWPTVGSNAVQVQGTVGLEGAEIFYSNPGDDAPATLTLLEYVPETKVVGTVQSQVLVTGTAPPYQYPATLVWDFAVTVPPGYERPILPTPPHGYRFSCTVSGGP